MIRTIIFLLFAALLVFGKSYHEIWRDEAHSWVFCAESTVYEIFKDLANFGHPILWYATVYPLVKLGLPVESMVWMHALMGIATAALLLFYSGMHWLLAGLYLVSVQFLFTHGVLTRGYMLMWLLLWLTAVAFKHRHQHKILYASLLALLANTEIWVAPLVAILGLEYVLYLYRHEDKITRYSKQNIISILILMIGAVLLLASMWPPENPGTYRKISFWDPAQFLTNLRHGFWPYSPFRIVRIFPAFVYNPIFQTGHVIILFLIITALCTCHRLVFLSFAATFSFIFYLFAARLLAHFWHSAVIFSLFIFFYWFASQYISKSNRRFTKLRKLALILLLPSLLYSAAIGGITLYYDYQQNYSAGEPIAEYIQQNSLTNHIILVDTCYKSSSFTAHLPHTDFFLVHQNRFSRFEQYAGCSKTPQNALDAFWGRFKNRADRLLITEKELKNAAQHGLKLLYWNRGLYYEKFWLYAPMTTDVPAP
jgi:hypothetical protein